MLRFASSILSHTVCHFTGIRAEASHPLPRSEFDHLVFHTYSSQSQHYDSFLLQLGGSNCRGQSRRMPQILKDNETGRCEIWQLQICLTLWDNTVKLMPHFTTGLVMSTKRIPFIFFTKNFVPNFNCNFFFITKFIRTTAFSSLLSAGNMTFHMISDLLKRHWCLSHELWKKPSNIQIKMAHRNYQD